MINLEIEKKTKREIIPRQEMPSQPHEERIKNFDEVPYGYTEAQAIKESQRCIQCKKPMCINGCPVGINIPEFIKKISERDFIGAAKIIKESNMLPAICGRVCPQEDQCEKLCVIGKKQAPVAIGNLERFAADFEVRHPLTPIPLIKSNGKKVAVVGSGPAGLACAGDLIKMGYQVTVFEALHKSGGVLVYGIPEFRLPKEIVQREIDYLKKLGVEFRHNYIIGKIKTVDELLKDDGYIAVFLANGAGLPVFMNIPGENYNGVYSANEYLTRANLMKAYRFPEYDMPIKRKGRVAVVGGGNVAMDAVRTAIRLGAEEALIIYRRSRTEMPARLEEIKHAEEEGVKFHFLTNPLRINADSSGWVSNIECMKMELGEPDESGRRRPVAIKGSEHKIDVDSIIIAIGSGSNPLIANTTPDLKVNKWGNIIVDSEAGCKTSKEGVFAGGDIVTGAATVILAMGAGRNAARSIDNYLKDKKSP